MIVKLKDLDFKKTGKILKVEGDSEIVRRIRDMGIVPGFIIEIIGRAPLYDPIAVKINGAVIALRENEADCISVEI